MTRTVVDARRDLIQCKNELDLLRQHSSDDELGSTKKKTSETTRKCKALYAKTNSALCFLRGKTAPVKRATAMTTATATAINLQSNLKGVGINNNGIDNCDGVDGECVGLSSSSSSSSNESEPLRLCLCVLPGSPATAPVVQCSRDVPLVVGRGSGACWLV
jgi:hypothetical protein